MIILDYAGRLRVVNHKDPEVEGRRVGVRKGDVMSKTDVGVMRRDMRKESRWPLEAGKSKVLGYPLASRRHTAQPTPDVSALDLQNCMARTCVVSCHYIFGIDI